MEFKLEINKCLKKDIKKFVYRKSSILEKQYFQN